MATPAVKQPAKSLPGKKGPKLRHTGPTWFVYMLECAGGRIYTGTTPDVAARFEKHRNGTGAAFTRMHKPLRLLAAMACGSRSNALKTEYDLKQLDRMEKLRWAKRWRYRKKLAAP